jgi:endonuclease/exonuclease/phosphatase family metal-dependent hydrolase
MQIISWNIFFNIDNLEWRTRQICKKLLEYDADIICLQEVSYFSWVIIKELLCTKYTSPFESPYKNNSGVRTFGEVILSKIEIIDKGFYKLDSLQGRTCSWIDIGLNIRVSTAHLESLKEKKYKDKRQKQMEMIKEHNKDLSWIWIGDSNLEKGEKNEMYDSGIDTYHANRFNEKLNYSYEYDKVWVSDDLRIKDFRVIGNEKVEDKWLSDHDGILVEINF